MKKIFLVALTCIFSFGCYLVYSKETVKSYEDNKIIGELSNREFLYEVLRYLYRWYLDETDVESVANSSTLDVNIRAIPVKLDEGDNSKFGELFFPAWNVSVKLKKADYKIDELQKEVKSDSFRVVNVSRIPGMHKLPDSKTVTLEVKKIKQYLFDTRHTSVFPDQELLTRIKNTFKDQLKSLKEKSSGGEKEVTAYIAPLSPVSNEIWIYYLEGRLLMRFSSDIDIVNPIVWNHEELFMDYYDVYNQMVVSHEEAAGSNEFMTRDQIGRALYNCVVLGKRIVGGE